MFNRLALIVALCAGGTLVHAAPQGSSFVYQGELREAGAPASGAFDFELVLFDAAVGGNQIDLLPYEDQPVVDGLFSLEVDFTDAPFTSGTRYWVEVRTRRGERNDSLLPLLPRQPSDRCRMPSTRCRWRRAASTRRPSILPRCSVG